MRNLRSPSVLVGLAACFALGVSVEACGSGTSFTTNGDDGGSGIPDGGDRSEAGDARLDAPAPPGEPLSVFGAYAAQRMFLGDTNRSGVPTKDAWKEYGANLDGIVSVNAPQGECLRQAGADSSKHVDGNGGIDNSFGKTVLGFILGLVPTPTKTANDEIAKGGRTMMLNLLPAAASNPARVGFLTAASMTNSVPFWGGDDVRAAAASSVGSGPEDALSTSTTPAMAGKLVASGIASGTFYVELPLQGSTWRIPIRLARVTMTVSADGVRATNGILAGVIPTEELVTEITKVAGRISTQLCGGSTLDTIKQTIRQASDILVDGTQDPTKACNAISIGIGFEAVKVTAAGVAAEPPPGPDPCL